MKVHADTLVFVNKGGVTECWGGALIKRFKDSTILVNDAKPLDLIPKNINSTVHSRELETMNTKILPGWVPDTKSVTKFL